MSTFISEINATVPPLQQSTQTQVLRDAEVLAATPAAVLGGAAVVGSALIAYAVEEAGDK